MRKRVENARNNLIIRFVIVLICAISIYGIFASYSVYKNMLNNNYKSIETSIDVSTENMGQTLAMIRGITYALSGSESIEKWRADQTYFTKENKKANLNQQHLNEEMQRVLTYNNTWNFELFDYITIYENDVLLAITYTKPFSTQQIIEDTAKIQERIKDDESNTLMLPPQDGSNVIFTTLKVQADFKSSDGLYIIGSTNIENFNNSLKSLVNYSGSHVYMMRKDGTVFASSDGEMLGEQLDSCLVETKSVHSEKRIDGLDYKIIKKKINKEFYIVYMLPRVEIMKQTFMDMRMFMVCSLLIGTVVVIFAIAAILKMTQMIKDLVLAMRRVSNKDYDVRLGSYNNPAYDELSESFNSMVEKLKELIQTTYESKILLDEMQIKSLQQQMNPHFLFNILLTIQIKAKMSGDETVYKMIYSLSSLLRAGIYGDKRMTIPISEEIKYVEYYLSLQKERYAERLTYQIDVLDDSILDCEIPRLAVEPIVENAIVHGVETIAEAAKVSVTLENDKEDILIIVKDNGVGFNVDDLGKEKEESLDGKIARAKTGIKSTDQRIRLLYGEPYGLNIKSEPEKGTQVEIRIPRKKIKRD